MMLCGGGLHFVGLAHDHVDQLPGLGGGHVLNSVTHNQVAGGSACSAFTQPNAFSNLCCSEVGRPRPSVSSREKLSSRIINPWASSRAWYTVSEGSFRARRSSAHSGGVSGRFRPAHLPVGVLPFVVILQICDLQRGCNGGSRLLRAVLHLGVHGGF